MKSTDLEQDRDAQNNGVSFDGHTIDGFDHKEVLSKQFLGLWGQRQILNGAEVVLSAWMQNPHREKRNVH